MVPNLPTPEGRALGAEIARLTGPVPDACGDCAFVLGTVPNGCGATLLDAIGCVKTGEPFMCHAAPGVLREPPVACRGWVTARQQMGASR